MIETGVLVDAEGALYWHLPNDRSSVHIGDSRTLWDAIWENRDALLLGFAHTHPGVGIPAPSTTDLTTFAAVEAALGRRIWWYIVSQTNVVVATWEGPGRLDYKVELCFREWYESWINELRKQSYKEESHGDA